MPGLLIRGDVHPIEPDLAALDLGVGLLQETRPARRDFTSEPLRTRPAS